MKFYKDPQDVLDYEIDWAAAAPQGPWLATGETITTSTWTITPTGQLAEAPAGHSKTNTTTTIWLLGGVAGQSYRVTNHIVTSQGREKDKSFDVVARDQ